MRFISYQIDSQHSFGALIENRVVDLARRMSNHSTLDDVIRAGALVRAKDIAAESSADYELKDILISHPMRHAGKIICIQWRTGNSPQESISDDNVFLRPAESLTGPEGELILPAPYQAVVARPALALVIGSGGRQLPEKRIRDSIAGVSLANSGAIRTWSSASGNPASGTVFPASGAIGPWLVTLDDVDHLNTLSLDCRVNDQQPQTLAVLQGPDSLAALISRLSEIVQLNPGDVVLAERFADDEQTAELVLTPGDQLTLCCDQLGTLSNAVTADPQTAEPDCSA